MATVTPLKRDRTARDMLAGIKVVDVDTHVTERWDLWTSRAPAALKARMPRVEQHEGKPTWMIDEDTVLSNTCGFSAVMADGSKVGGFGFIERTIHDAHKGAYDTRARLDFMDEHGIHAQITYPNLLGFGGQNAMLIPEDLRVAAVEIYNDAMAEMQAESNDRIFPMALLPWWDVKRSIAEAERCAKMGMRGININPEPYTHGVPPISDPHWDDLWHACVQHDLPVNFHIGGSDVAVDWFFKSSWPGATPDEQLMMGGVMLFIGNLRIMGNILLSRFLERHPTLKLVSVESGAAWIPYLIEAMEYMAAENNVSFDVPLSEVFRRQIYACTFFERKNFIDTIHQVGADNIMWESDYPHPACLYPGGLEYMEEALVDMTEEERYKVFSGNAKRLYNLPI
jgi:predicted TIM-barrel fold metal-dependent hydrolase